MDIVDFFCACILKDFMNGILCFSCDETKHYTCIINLLHMNIIPRVTKLPRIGALWLIVADFFFFFFYHGNSLGWAFAAFSVGNSLGSLGLGALA